MSSDPIWDRRAAAYDSLRWVHDPDLLGWVERHAVAAIVGAPGVRDAIEGGAPVCEVGVGTGALTVRLARHGFPLLGLDVSDRMLARCRERLAGDRRRVRLAQVFPDAPLSIVAPGGVAAVVSRMVLHHAPCPPAEQVRRWVEAIRPGCAVVVAEGPPPVRDRTHPAWSLYVDAMARKEPGRWTFTTADVAEWLLDAGCVEVRTAERWTHDNSLRAWLRGNDADPAVAEEVERLHAEAFDLPEVREAYRMTRAFDGDLVMRWRHSVVSGVRS